LSRNSGLDSSSVANKGVDGAIGVGGSRRGGVGRVVGRDRVTGILHKRGVTNTAYQQVCSCVTVCVYARVFVCVCVYYHSVCVCACLCVCMCLCVCACVLAHVHANVRVFASSRVLFVYDVFTLFALGNTQLCMCVSACVCVYLCVRACARAHM